MILFASETTPRCVIVKAALLIFELSIPGKYVPLLWTDSPMQKLLVEVTSINSNQGSGAIINENFSNVKICYIRGIIGATLLIRLGSLLKISPLSIVAFSLIFDKF